MPSDEASLKGKGAEIMLPGRGNPFRPATAPQETSPAADAPVSFSISSGDALPEGAPDLSPEDLARFFPEVVSFSVPTVPPDEAPAWAVEPTENVSLGLAAETPADAALAEVLNNPAPAWANFQAEAAPEVDAEPLAFSMSAEMARPTPDLIASETAPQPPTPELIASETAPLPELPSPDELAHFKAIVGADTSALGSLSFAAPQASGLPTAQDLAEFQAIVHEAGSAGSVASSMPSAPTGGSSLSAVVPTTARLEAVANRSLLESASQPARPSGEDQLPDLGPGSQPFKRAPDLPSNADLVKMLVTDQRVTDTWNEIDALEKDIAVTPRLSQGVAEEMFGRLATARNRLLSGRDQIEEAELEIAAVKYRFARVQRTKWFEEPNKLFVYLIVMLLFVSIGLFLTLSQQAGDLSAAALWSTVLAGGIGGVAGGLYALWHHVASKKDYDPEFAMWYYSYPIMGLLLGAFVYLIVKLGLFQIGKSDPLTVYLLAPLIGFKQDVAFKWINNWLKQVIPSDSGGK